MATAALLWSAAERWWPEATVAGEDTEADLFVRRLAPSRAPHRFPVLART